MEPDREVNLVAIEIVVRDLDDATAFFADTVGFPVRFRGPALDAPGELAVVDVGGVALTLLQPSATGDNVMSDRTPRVTQFVFGVDQSSSEDLRDRIEARGVAADSAGPTRFFVPPQVTEGVIGPFLALTFTVVEPD